MSLMNSKAESLGQRDSVYSENPAECLPVLSSFVLIVMRMTRDVFNWSRKVRALEDH